jgi:hypothetical protein
MALLDNTPRNLVQLIELGLQATLEKLTLNLQLVVSSCLSLQIELILGYFLLQLFGFLWVDAFLERHKSHLQVVDLSLQGIVLLLLS